MFVKNKILLFVLGNLFNYGLFSQYQSGSYSFSAGYGFPNMMNVINKYRPHVFNYSYSGVGPIHTKASVFITRKIEVGLNINYVNYNGTWKKNDQGKEYNYRLNTNSVAGLLRLNFHLEDYSGDNFDLYWGCALGAGTINYYSVTDNPNEETFNKNFNNDIKSFELTLGAKYFVTENIATYVELGYAKSIIQGGICITLNKD